ncbi:MAG: citryl-CoA lyase [Rubrivivax sp.]|nr:MAG: citryl-CoA lyase [Rubrivivax sp.]
MSVQPIHTSIWLEEPEADNPFATRAAHCHGYDVYGDMLGRARWADMLYLLFRGEAPSATQARLLDALAVALANPGPRDPAVHAAMCGGVGGSTAAASLMAALAVGAGQSGGAREVFLAMRAWTDAGCDLAAWQRLIATPPLALDDVWPAPEHAPGFDPNGLSTPTVVRQTLAVCADLSAGPCLPWLQSQLARLENLAGLPIAMTGVAAAALSDLGLNPAEGEMLYLLLRLPGAAVHALEQGREGYKRFPFYPVELQDDPAATKEAA